MIDATIQLMCNEKPVDIRDGQLVCIERLDGVAMLERDGRVESSYEEDLAGILGKTKGRNYLNHDPIPYHHEVKRISLSYYFTRVSNYLYIPDFLPFKQLWCPLVPCGHKPEKASDSDS